MNELSKNIVCIVIRGNIEIWVEQDRAENMVNLLTGNNAPQFVKYENRLINRADVVGIFTAQDMEGVTRRKNNQWQCKQGFWHEKSDKCICLDKAKREWLQRRFDAIAACGKCEDGLVRKENLVDICTCQEGLLELSTDK